jgi:hypothetical protein
MDMPKTLLEAFDPKLFVQNPMQNAMEVARIQSWNLIGHEERTNFRLAVLQALTTCGPALFVQKMEIFLNALKYRRDEFARMMLEYNNDWKRHNIHAQMAAILGQQQPVAALAGPAMGQANTPYIPQRPPWTLPRGRPDSTYASDRLAQPEVRKPYETYASDRLAQPEVRNPYETSALYPQVPQALESPRPTYTYMKLPGPDKIPDWEAGPNPRAAKTGSAKLDSSLFSMEFLSKPALKNKPMPEASFKPKPEPPAKHDPVAVEALICQAKDEAVREFKDSMVAPAAGFMEDIQERFKKVKDILQEYHNIWAEVNGELPMNQEQETTMAGLLNRFKGVCREIMTENHAVAIAAQELVDTVTGTGGAGVQDDSKVVSSDPDDNDETMEQGGGESSDDEKDDKDKPLVGTPKGTSKAKSEGMRKVASQGNPNKGRALGVAKVIRKHARANTGAKDNTGPAKRGPAKKGPAKSTPDPVKPPTDTAKPPTDPAKPPTDAMMLEDIKVNASWD